MLAIPIQHRPIIETSIPHKADQDEALEGFRYNIQQMVRHFENNSFTEYSISHTAKKFNIKRRRLYDVINVLEALGICRKAGFDLIKWYGLDQINSTLKDHVQKRRINTTESLETLFNPDQCVGVQNLTVQLLLLFIATGKETLDVRNVSNYFSRRSDRTKTTLCKLYQVSDILHAIGLVERTNKVWEIRLSEKLTSMLKQSVFHPMSIKELLNPIRTNKIFENRIQELEKYACLERV